MTTQHRPSRRWQPPTAEPAELTDDPSTETTGRLDELFTPGAPVRLVPLPPPVPEPILDPIGAAAADWQYTPTLAPTPRRQPPAQSGWRAGVRTLTAGLIKLKPGRAELAHRHATSVIRRTLPAGRVVIVANEKGGSGKTPTSIILAGTIARLRSESNVVWDVNEMRGSLGLRAETPYPSATILDILANADSLSRPDAPIGELLSYLRRQPEGHLVLASTDDGTAMRQIDYADCDRVLQLLQRRFGLIIADTGNNAAADTFRYILDSADVLVIPAHPSPAHLAPARKLLGAVAAREATKHLVHKAVLVITSYDGAQMPVEEIDWFTDRGIRVLHVPADPIIAANGPIPLADLSSASTQAWTVVAAAVIDAANHARSARSLDVTRPASAATLRPAGSSR